jgi:hypothetical protein
MRLFLPDYDHAAVARWLRREAMKGFQRGDDPSTWRYVEACTCGVNLLPAPNSVSLIFTRDSNPDCKVGWHLSVCCVTHKAYRGYVPAEGEHWRQLVFGKYAPLAVEQPLTERSPYGVKKDVRHFIIECVWADHKNPVVTLEGIEE